MTTIPFANQMDAIFESFNHPNRPGCCAAVMKDGEIIANPCYGFANLDDSLPITPDTTFNIGSVSKQFTAFAILLLEQQGKLALTADLREFLPEIPDFGVLITLNHLLQHTSGIPNSYVDLLTLGGWQDGDVTTTRDVFGLLQRMKRLNFIPGDEYLYSNSNYVLLALIVERLSGKTFRDFCKQSIFEPLKMNHTQIHQSNSEVILNRAQGYYEHHKQWRYQPLTDCVVGPTNVYSTAGDLMRWEDNFFTGKVGGKTLVNKMHQNGQLNDGTPLDYHFGLVFGEGETYRGWKRVSHAGGHGCYSSYLCRFPEQHLSIAVLFNTFLWSPEQYAHQIADLILPDSTTGGEEIVECSEDSSSPTFKPSEPELQALTGIYFSDQLAALRPVTFEEGKLHYNSAPLIATGENHFIFEEEPSVQVVFSPQGVKIIASTREYHYQRMPDFDAESCPLSDYLGRYYSAEVDSYWEIIQSKESLIVHRPRLANTSLEPVFADGFSNNWEPILDFQWIITLIFERDETGKVIGFRSASDGARNIHFERL